MFGGAVRNSIYNTCREKVETQDMDKKKKKKNTL